MNNNPSSEKNGALTTKRASFAPRGQKTTEKEPGAGASSKQNEFFFDDKPGAAPSGKAADTGKKHGEAMDSRSGTRAASANEFFAQEPASKPASVPSFSEPKPTQTASPRDDSGWSNGTGFSSRSASAGAPRRSNLFLPLIILLTFMVVVAIILPRQPVFSHEIEVDENYVSTLQSASDSMYISMGDSGAAVTSLQKALYKMGYISYDDINGEFDSATLSAVNSALAFYNVAEAEREGCSYNSFELIIRKANEITDQPEIDDPDSQDATGEEPTTTTTAPTTDDAENEGTTTTTAATTEATTTTTEATTTTTKAAVLMVRVTIDPLIKLRKEPDENSPALYNVEKGTEHEVLEEKKDAQGKTWYRIKFFYDYPSWRSGWVLGDYVETFYE